MLFSPAGMPLAKPMLDSFLLLSRQAFEGLYPLREIAAVVADAVSHPLATYRLARQAHDLDLSEELARVAAAGVPAFLVGCVSGTLTTPAACSRVAAGLGAQYRQVEGAGHMWMLRDWPGSRAALAELG